MPMRPMPPSFLDETLRPAVEGLEATIGGTTRSLRLTTYPQGRNGIVNPDYRKGSARLLGEHPTLGRDIACQVAMPLDMIRAQVQPDRYIRCELRRDLQLVGAEFQNDHATRPRIVEVERRATKVAANFDGHARVGQNVADQGGGR